MVAPRTPEIEADSLQVALLCERVGFGFVMQEAARLWADLDPAGAFAVGPCLAFVKRCGCRRQGSCRRCAGCGWQFDVQPRRRARARGAR